MPTLYEVLNATSMDFRELSDTEKIQVVNKLSTNPKELYNALINTSDDFKALSPSEREQVIKQIIPNSSSFSDVNAYRSKEQSKQQGKIVLTSDGTSLLSSTPKDKRLNNDTVSVSDTNDILTSMEKSKPINWKNAAKGFLYGGAKALTTIPVAIDKAVGAMSQDEIDAFYRDMASAFGYNPEEKGATAAEIAGSMLLDPVNYIPVGFVTKYNTIKNFVLNAAKGAAYGVGSSALYNYADGDKDIARNTAMSGAVSGTMQAVLGALVGKKGKAVQKLIDEGTVLQKTLEEGKAPVETAFNKLDEYIDKVLTQVDDKDIEKISNNLDITFQKLGINPDIKAIPYKIEMPEDITKQNKLLSLVSDLEKAGISIEDIKPKLVDMGISLEDKLNDIDIKLSQTKIQETPNALYNVDEITGAFKTKAQELGIIKPPVIDEIKEIKSILDTPNLKELTPELQTTQLDSTTKTDTKKGSDFGTTFYSGVPIHKLSELPQPVKNALTSFSLGLANGFKKDENGNWVYDPEIALKTGLSFAGVSFLASRYSDKMFKPLQWLDEKFSITKTISKGVSPIKALGQPDIYTAHLNRQGMLNTADEILQKLIGKFSKATDEHLKFAYDYWTDQSAHASYKGVFEYFNKHFPNLELTEFDKSLLKDFAAVKRAINSALDFAIKNKIIKEADVASLRNGYLQRVYLAHILKEKNNILTLSGTQSKKLELFKHRKEDIENVIKKINNNEIIFKVPEFKDFAIDYLQRKDVTEETQTTLELINSAKSYFGDTIKNIDTRALREDIKKLKELEQGSISKYMREYLGEIKQADYLAVITLRKAMLNKINYDFLDAISKNPNLTLPESLVEYKGKTMSVFALKQELDELLERKVALERLNHSTEVIDSEIENITQILDSHHEMLLDRGIDLENLRSDSYRKIEGKVFGRLNGMYVTNEAYDMLKSVYTLELNPDAFIKNLGTAAEEITKLFKKAQTVWNIPTHFRNTVTNVFINDLDGYTVSEQIKDAVELVSNPSDLKKLWIQAKRRGLISSTFAYSELTSLKQKLLKANAAENSIEKIFTILKPIKAVDDAFVKAYQMEDAVFKLLRYYREIKLGRTADEAAAIAAQNLFDYSDVSRFVEHFRSNPVSSIAAPFASFTAKSLEKTVETFIQNPVRLFKWYAFISLLNFFNNIDTDAMHTLAADYKKDSTGILGTTVYGKDRKENKYYGVDIGVFLPQSVFVNTTKNIATGEFKDAVRTLGFANMPIMNATTILLTHRDPFTGRDLTADAMPGENIVPKLLAHAAKMMIPSSLRPETGAAANTYKLLSGRKNKYGEEISPFVILQWFGIPVEEITRKKVKTETLAAIKAMEMDLTKDKIRAKRNMAMSKNFSDEDKRDLKERYINSKKYIKEEAKRRRQAINSLFGN